MHYKVVWCGRVMSLTFTKKTDIRFTVEISCNLIAVIVFMDPVIEQFNL